MRETRKSKTAAKTILYKKEHLKRMILKTMKMASDLVGSTLGPNGKIVLIERQENLSPYVTKDGISVFNSMAFSDPTQQVVLEAARDSSAKTNVEAGDGPQPLYSKVLTPRGFVAMGDLKVGMEICGTNGSVQTVLGIFPKGEKQVYEVEFSDGRVVECCSDHLWKVTTNYGVEKTLPLSSLMEDYKTINVEGYPRHRYYTPRTFVEFSENKLEMPLDPYLVGVLLGDGSLTGTGSIELSLGKKKQHILSKLILPEGIRASSSYVESRNYYRVKLNGTTPQGRTMADIVQSIGLLGANSSTKFIPKSYLYASKQTREQLLQGLIDTDGHINDSGNFEYSTVSTELYKDFLTLVQSLGIPVHSYMLSRKENSSYSETPIFKVTQLKGEGFGDKIVRISATDKMTPMQCIKVSNEDSLYITDNFIVTHNTTTATILAESLIRLGFEYLEKNPRLSTQKVMRELESTYSNIIAPFIQENAKKISTSNSDDLLKKVAMVATNNDEEMSSAVIEGFATVGHSGNFTIVETPGVGGFAVERIEGFPISRGFEDTCGRFLEEFVNDKPNYRTVLEKPKFILYNGQLNDIALLMPILNDVAEASAKPVSEGGFSPNVVIVAHSFSENVLGFLAQNFSNIQAIKPLPLKTPLIYYQANAQYHFLLDLSAFTGAKIFDPLTKPLPTAKLEDLGIDSMDSFEFYRYRSVLLGTPDSLLIEVRAAELEQQAKHAESINDKEILTERLALLTGGIARLKVYGSSDSELKEKKHRVEDAVAAVKGAIKYGVLPGCSKTLLTLSKILTSSPDVSPAVKAIMAKAFMEPFFRILDNGGMNEEEKMDTLRKIMYSEYTETSKILNDFFYTYDAMNFKYGDAIEIGVLDSASAVNMAIKNSLSVSKMLMGLSGTVVFQRDNELERQEARDLSSESRAMEEAIKESDRQVWEPPY